MALLETCPGCNAPWDQFQTACPRCELDIDTIDWMEKCPEAPEPDRISKLRGMVRDHAARKVEGEIIDVQSANAIVTVYDALNEANREKFVNLSSVSRMATVAWKLVK